MARSEFAGIGGCPRFPEPLSPGSFSLQEPRPVERESSASPRTAQLARTIETEIIPRLLLAHRAFPECAEPDDDRNLVPCREQVAEFAKLVLERDVRVSSSYVAALRARGSSIEMILLHLLAPTARLLGDLWKEDLCSFGEVTVGLSRLQQILRELSSPFENEIEHADHGRRALLAAAPGEQHTFGVCVVEEFFRRAGWDVWTETRSTREDLVALVRSESFDVIGVSLSCDVLFDELPSFIHALRRAARNRSMGVMVGGRLFLDNPELVAHVGADATAADGLDAVQQSRRLLDRPARIC